MRPALNPLRPLEGLRSRAWSIGNNSGTSVTETFSGDLGRKTNAQY
jgi:hypothetical protein